MTTDALLYALTSPRVALAVCACAVVLPAVGWLLRRWGT